jgi:hypothetical protein
MSRQSFRAQNKLKGIRNSLSFAHTFWPFPPWGRRFGPRHPFPVGGFFIYLQIQPKPILSLAPSPKVPFPSRRLCPKWSCPERIRRCLCACCDAAAKKTTAYFDRISFYTHPPIVLFAIARGWGWAVQVCALVAHTVFSGNHRF